MIYYVTKRAMERLNDKKVGRIIIHAGQNCPYTKHIPEQDMLGLNIESEKESGKIVYRKCVYCFG